MLNKVKKHTKKRLRCRRWLFFLLPVFALTLLTGCEKKKELIVPLQDSYAENSGLTDGFSSESPAEVLQEDESEEAASENYGIFVHVCGAVLNEGVYELPEGSRVADAIKAAGGLSEEAAGYLINQAAEITDGSRIYIPSEDEAEDEAFSSPDTSNSSVSAGNGLVNINTASAAELCTLPGIGEKRAADIIRYRDTNGTFGNKEDLKNVPGIGDGIFGQIKEQITTGAT